MFPEAIDIWVNGEEATVSAGLTVATLLLFMEVQPDRVAVEVDKKIIKKSEWFTTHLKPGARVEVVSFVGGG